MNIGQQKDLSNNILIDNDKLNLIKQTLPQAYIMNGRTITYKNVFTKFRTHGWGCHREKGYIMPSGAVKIIQGYEPLALDILLEKYNENYIKIDGNVPIISWIDNNHISHKYTPDIYLSNENKLIEVKSTWTYNQPYSNGRMLLIPRACIKLGYKYEYWVFDKYHNLYIVNDFTKDFLEPIKDTPKKTNKPKRRVLYLDNLDN